MGAQCRLCGVVFRKHVSLVIHYQDAHPSEEGLKCPGCSECQRFVGDLISHLDEGKCPKIYQSEWLAFRKEKQAEIEAKGGPNFGRFVTTTAAGSTSDWETYAIQYGTGQFPVLGSRTEGFKEEEFPTLPGPDKPKKAAKASAKAVKLPPPVWSLLPAAKPVQGASQSPESTAIEKKGSKKAAETKAAGKENRKTSEKAPAKHQGAKKTPKTVVKAPQPSSITAQGGIDKPKEPEATPKDESSPAPKPNAWAQKKNLFPDAAPVQRPTEEQLKIATAPNAKQMYFLGIHDPDHPHYDVEKYKSRNGRYECPMDNCITTFATGEGLSFHLSYLGEHGGKKAECPGCHKRFKTSSALAHHAQMVGDRCRLKSSQHFGQFVDEVSSGLVKADGVDDDNNIKYEVTDAASTRFTKSRKPAKVVEEEYDDFYDSMLEGEPDEDMVIVTTTVNEDRFEGSGW